MNVLDPTNLVSHPMRIVEETFDCIWIVLSRRTTPQPLKGKALQTLDWKMGGALSRLILQDEKTKHETTFLPTMHRLGTPYLAVVVGKSFDASHFVESCEGLKAKEVLVFSEDEDKTKELSQVLDRSKAKGFPARVRIAYELQKGTKGSA